MLLFHSYLASLLSPSPCPSLLSLPVLPLFLPYPIVVHFSSPFPTPLSAVCAYQTPPPTPSLLSPTFAAALDLRKLANGWVRPTSDSFMLAGCPSCSPTACELGAPTTPHHSPPWPTLCSSQAPIPPQDLSVDNTPCLGRGAVCRRSDRRHWQPCHAFTSSLHAQHVPTAPACGPSSSRAGLVGVRGREGA